MLSWLGALRLPELAERPKLQLHNLVFWADVLEAADPGLAPDMPRHRGDEGGDRGAADPRPGGPQHQPGLRQEEPAAQQHGGDEVAPRTVRMATANVLTLHPGEERGGAEGSARRILLEEQFAEAGIHFVGIQEARSPQSEVRKGRGFTRVVAAADAGGRGGVELWINSKLRIDPESGRKSLLSGPRHGHQGLSLGNFPASGRTLTTCLPGVNTPGKPSKIVLCAPGKLSQNCTRCPGEALLNQYMAGHGDTGVQF